MRLRAGMAALFLLFAVPGGPGEATVPDATLAKDDRLLQDFLGRLRNYRTLYMYVKQDQETESPVERRWEYIVQARSDGHVMIDAIASDASNKRYHWDGRRLLVWTAFKKGVKDADIPSKVFGAVVDSIRAGLPGAAREVHPSDFSIGTAPNYALAGRYYAIDVDASWANDLTVILAMSFRRGIPTMVYVDGPNTPRSWRGGPLRFAISELEFDVPLSDDFPTSDRPTKICLPWYEKQLPKQSCHPKHHATNAPEPGEQRVRIIHLDDAISEPLP